MIFNIINNVLVFLLFYDFAFKDLITIQYVSLVIGETVSVYYHVVLKKVTMFPTLYYEYDCYTVCHKNFITIHSLGYREATVSINKATIKQPYCFFVISA